MLTPDMTFEKMIKRTQQYEMRTDVSDIAAVNWVPTTQHSRATPKFTSTALVPTSQPINNELSFEDKMRETIAANPMWCDRRRSTIARATRGGDYRGSHKQETSKKKLAIPF